MHCTVYSNTHIRLYEHTHAHTTHIPVTPHMHMHPHLHVPGLVREGGGGGGGEHTHRDEPILESAHLNLLVYIHNQTVHQHSMLCHCSRGQNRAVDQPLHTPQQRLVTPQPHPCLHQGYTCATAHLPHVLHPRYHMCYIGASQTHYLMCGHVRYMYMHALILHTPLAEFKMTSSLFFEGMH